MAQGRAQTAPRGLPCVLQVGTQTLYPIPVKVTNADEARDSSGNEGGGDAERGRGPEGEGECVEQQVACNPPSAAPRLSVS